MLSVSVVVPIYNEQENVEPLYAALNDILPTLDRDYEIILVDDGSSDDSLAGLLALTERDSAVKVVELRGNFGQSAAMLAGIQQSSGDVIITMDGDLQNDPADIPDLLAKIDEGFDLVHGWRKDRQDALVSRKIPSRIANRLISRVTQFPVNDLGCTLKAVRREVAQELELYGEMHRFIPILASWRGARCAEIVTRHHPRRFGTSKYGLSRVTRVILDLITVKFLIQFLVSPMRLFGVLGAVSCLVGLASGVATIVMKLANQVDMTGNPLLLLAVLGTIVGVQFFGLGMLGELGSRIYFAVRHKQPFAIRRLVNFEQPAVAVAESQVVTPVSHRRAA